VDQVDEKISWKKLQIHDEFGGRKGGRKKAKLNLGEGAMGLVVQRQAGLVA
jgi:hypothetical protein